MTSTKGRNQRPTPLALFLANALFGALVCVSLAVPSANAQSTTELDELRSEIESLKQGQKAILKELLELKKRIPRQIRRENQPQELSATDIDIDGAAFLGNPDAAVTLVEFTDYQCPFCRRHSVDTKPRIVETYVETGKLRYMIREFPIASLHPQATKAAEAALCAGDQGKYWEMHTTLFANQKRLQPQDLRTYAGELGLDTTTFNRCFEGNKYAARVRQDQKDGIAAGVRGTPTFFLGVTDPKNPGQFRATRMLSGALPFDSFKRAIDELLADAAKGS